MAIKILHIIGAMDAGGVESWLMNVVRSTDQNEFDHSFSYQKNKKAFYDDELNKRGNKIYICELKNPLIYTLKLIKLIIKVKPDVIHSHVYTFSALIMIVSFFMRIKVRISHAHSDRRLIEKESSFLKKIYIQWAKYCIKIFSTHCLAVSKKAEDSLFPQPNKKARIIYCGVDLLKFKNNENLSNKMRNSLGIPNKAIVLGHIGRFVKAKNHRFLIDVFNSVYQRNSNYYLVLVGAGELFDYEKKYAESLPCKNNIIFLGLRSDINNIVNNLFNIFVFPSLWEGLPITLIEAQASGLPCLISDAITDEICFSNTLKINLKLDSWVGSIISTKVEKIYDPKLFNSDFNINNCLINLNSIYLIAGNKENYENNIHS